MSASYEILQSFGEDGKLGIVLLLGGLDEPLHLFERRIEVIPDRAGLDD